MFWCHFVSQKELFQLLPAPHGLPGATALEDKEPDTSRNFLILKKKRTGLVVYNSELLLYLYDRTERRAGGTARKRMTWIEMNDAPTG